MASPLTSSPAASPHQPSNSNAHSASRQHHQHGQFNNNPSPSTPNAQNNRQEHPRESSYLEPIQIIYPEIIPLEWAIPLVRSGVSTSTSNAVNVSSSTSTTATASSSNNSGIDARVKEEPTEASGESNAKGVDGSGNGLLAPPSANATFLPSAAPATNVSTPTQNLTLPSGSLTGQIPPGLSTPGGLAGSVVGAPGVLAAAFPTASPANAPSVNTAASQTLTQQTQKPWRIRWACYKAKAEDQYRTPKSLALYNPPIRSPYVSVTGGLAEATPPFSASAGGRTSMASTPASTHLLRIPHTLPNSSIAHRIALSSPANSSTSAQKRTGKGRDRAFSHTSKQSGGGNDNDLTSGNGARPHKKPKRSRSRAPPQHGSDADLHSRMRKLFGTEHTKEYQQISDLIKECRSRPSPDVLQIRKQQYLRGISPSRAAKTASTTAAASSSMKAGQASYDQPLKGEAFLRPYPTAEPFVPGILPERLAIINRASTISAEGLSETQNADSTTQSEKGKTVCSDPLLYLFSIANTTPLYQTEGTEPDELFETCEDMHLESSGTFTASDLFPSLFNDNGVYTPPSAMHPAPVHPMSSAASLTAGQSSASNKVPFLVSSFNVWSSSNKEAVSASEAFLKAAENHILTGLAQSYHPDIQIPTNTVKSTQNFDKSNQQPQLTLHSHPIKMGHGIIYPSTIGPSLPRHSHVNRSDDGHISSASESQQQKALYLSCSSWFTAADLRIGVNPSRVNFTSLLRLSQGQVDRKNTFFRTAQLQNNRITKGQVVVLCPMALPVIFLRWYGRPGENVSRVQSEGERASIPLMRQDFLTMFEDQDGLSNDACGESDSWILCTFGEGLDIVWPASQVVMAHPQNHSATETPTTWRKRLPSRIRYATAKSSSHLPRSLFFQTRSSRNTKLVAASAAYIEKQSKERERERREKAEKALNDSSNWVGNPPPSDQLHAEQEREHVIHQHQAHPQANTERDAVSDEPVTVGDEAADLTKSSNLPTAHYMAPTYESVLALLDSIPGIDEGDEAEDRSRRVLDSNPAIQVDGIQIQFPEGSDVSEVHQQYPAALYPTPINSNSQPSMNTGSTEAGASEPRPPSPPRAANKSLAEIFNDFSWTNYSEGNPTSYKQQTSRPSSSYGYGQQNMTFDEQASFGLFDTVGLTDEDFSFFDSPDAGIAATLSEVPADTAQHSRIVTQNTSNISADDLASFVRTSGPVDHFGHLMPKTPFDMSKSQSQGMSFGTADPLLDFNTPASTNSGPYSFDIAAFGSPIPQATFAQDVTPTQDSNIDQLHNDVFGIRIASGLSGPTEVGGDAQSDSPSQIKYSTSHQAAYTEQGTPSHRDPALPSESMFTPLRFLPPSLPTLYSIASDNLMEEKRTENLFCAEDTCSQHMLARATHLKASLTRVSSQHPDNAGPLLHVKRPWQRDLAAPVENLSSTSSSTDSENSGESPDTETELPVHSSPMVHSIPPKLFSLLSTTFTQLLPRLLDERPDQSAGDVSGEHLARINRGEREAVATIFMQHTLENIDFRERQLYAYRGEANNRTPHVLGFSRAGWANAQKLVRAAPSDIDVRRNHAVTEVSLSALKNWSRLKLVPHSGPKDTQALVLVATSILDETVKAAIQTWLHKVAETWEVSGRAIHCLIRFTDCDTRRADSGGTPMAKAKTVYLASTVRRRSSETRLIYNSGWQPLVGL